VSEEADGVRAAHGGKPRKGVAVTDADGGPRGPEHAREPGPADVRVDQGADGAKLGDGPDRGEEERAVHAQDRDRRSLDDAGATERARDTIHLLVVGGVGERLVLERERDAIGNLLGLAADQRAEGVGGGLEIGENAAQVDRSLLGRAPDRWQPRTAPEAPARRLAKSPAIRSLVGSRRGTFGPRGSPAFCSEISTLDDCVGLTRGRVSEPMSSRRAGRTSTIVTLPERVIPQAAPPPRKGFHAG